jgi:hypothetical protein
MSRVYSLISVNACQIATVWIPWSRVPSDPVRRPIRDHASYAFFFHIAATPSAAGLSATKIVYMSVRIVYPLRTTDLGLAIRVTH